MQTRNRKPFTTMPTEGAILPADLLAAHPRVRRTSKVRNVQHRVEPQLPPDVLGIYVFLPMGWQ